MQKWVILTLAPETDEADLRRICANKLTGVYEIYIPADEDTRVVQVAVLSIEDEKRVLNSFAVVDKRFGRRFKGESASKAAKARK